MKRKEVSTSSVDKSAAERSFAGRTGLFIFFFLLSLQTYTTCKTKHVSMQKRDTKLVRFPTDLTYDAVTKSYISRHDHCDSNVEIIFTCLQHRVLNATGSHRSLSLCKNISNRRLIYDRLGENQNA